MMRAAILAVALLPSIALAQGGPPPGFFPKDMPNMGSLYIEFCYIGSHVCFDQEAQVWGQVCNSSSAEYASEGGVETTPPIGSHYVGWRCGENGELIPRGKEGWYINGKFEENVFVGK